MGGAPTHTTGHPHSLLRPVAECPPFGLMQKQVHFDLATDLGKIPSLPTNLTSFLGEDITDEWIDVPSPPDPLTKDPLQLPCDNANQHHSTHIRGARPKNQPAKPMAAI